MSQPTEDNHDDALSENETGAAAAAPAGGTTDSPITDLVAAFDSVRFTTVETRSAPPQDVAEVPREILVAFVSAAREVGFRMFVDLCAVDYLRRDPRFEVVISLLSLDPPARLRLRVPVAGREPTVPSITSIYPGANFYEREAYDLFGIDFPGHPDLSRILMPDDWEGYPLRKDYGVGSVPVQFKGAHKAT